MVNYYHLGSVTSGILVYIQHLSLAVDVTYMDYEGTLSTNVYFVLSLYIVWGQPNVAIKISPAYQFNSK